MYVFSKLKQKKDGKEASFPKAVQHLPYFCAAYVRLEPTTCMKMLMRVSELVLQSLCFSIWPGEEGWDFSLGSGLCMHFVSLD